MAGTSGSAGAEDEARALGLSRPEVAFAVLVPEPGAQIG